MTDPLFPATVAIVSTLLCMQERIEKARTDEEIWTFSHDSHDLLNELLDDDEWIDSEPLIEQLQFRSSDQEDKDLAIEYAMYEGPDLHQDCRLDIRYDPPTLSVSSGDPTVTGAEVIYDIMTVVSLLCMSPSDKLVITNGKKERLVRERRAAMRLVPTSETS